jgi:hypothetical protein
MTPAWQSALAAALGIAALAMAAASIALARRAGGLARRVDDLSSRLEALEVAGSASLGGRGRAGGEPPAQGRSGPALAGGSLRSTPATPSGLEARKARRADPAAPLIAVPSLATAGSEAAAIEAGAELGRRFGAIWEMADLGEPAASIARATGHPIGQVELILGLRRPSVLAPGPREAGRAVSFSNSSLGSERSGWPGSEPEAKPPEAVDKASGAPTPVTRDKRSDSEFPAPRRKGNGPREAATDG